MKMSNLMDATILIVENDEEQLQSAEGKIDDIERSRRENDGIAEFIIEKVTSFDEAIRILEERVPRPFNIVLLDLNLDDTDPIDHESESRFFSEDDSEFSGFQILEYINKTDTAEAVIVISGYHEDDNLLETFRKGSSDFIIKPYEQEELQQRILVCWSRLMLNKSQKLLDHRINDLVPYAEKGLAYRFNKYFLDITNEIKDSTENLERYMRERYGLDSEKDKEDVFFKSLSEQENSIKKIKVEWEALQTSLSMTDKSLEKKDVAELLIDIHQSLLPCFIVKNVELDFQDESISGIFSFENDVSAVIKEIIMGILINLPDQSRAKPYIKINCENIKEQVCLSISDSSNSIKSEHIESINRASSTSFYQRFGREWGLSIVQQIAMRGAGRLEIQQDEQGNTVNYFIPTSS